MTEQNENEAGLEVNPKDTYSAAAACSGMMNCSCAGCLASELGEGSEDEIVRNFLLGL